MGNCKHNVLYVLEDYGESLIVVCNDCNEKFQINGKDTLSENQSLYYVVKNNNLTMSKEDLEFDIKLDLLNEYRELFNDLPYKTKLDINKKINNLLMDLKEAELKIEDNSYQRTRKKK